MSSVKDLLFKYLKHQSSFWKRELDQRILHGRLPVPVHQLYEHIHCRAVPSFVLSTGRCGTKLLSDIIQINPNFVVAHQPTPELSYMAGYAYQQGGTNTNEGRMLIDACRYEAIRDAWLLNKTYVETNNRITFFTPQLVQLYPNSRFIHLERDAIGFVASGYSRNWYAYEKLFDEGRITPRPEADIPWEGFSQVQKIAWLWVETNRFIRESLSLLSDERKFYIESGQLYTDPAKVRDLLKFIGITDIPITKIKKTQSRPVNVQPKSRRKELSEEQKEEIREIIKKYGV